MARICTQAMLMSSGRCLYHGTTAEAIDQYNAAQAAKSGTAYTLQTHEAIQSFALLDCTPPQTVQAGSSLKLKLKLKSQKRLPVGIAFINFVDLAATTVGQADFSARLEAIPEGESELSLTIERVDLAQGIYSLNLAIFASNRQETLVHGVSCAQVNVAGAPYMWCAYKMPLGAVDIQIIQA